MKKERTIVYSKGLGDKWIFELSDGVRGYKTKDSMFFAVPYVRGYIGGEFYKFPLDKVEDNEVRKFLEGF